MHPRRLLAVLGVVVLTSMTSCTSFSSSRSSSMDKTGWITHCFGRFLIDLPPDAVINAGYYLWGDRIEYLDDKPTELAARVDRLEQEWRTQRHKSKGNMFLRKIDFGNESVGLLSWSSEVASKTYLLDTYVTSKPTWHVYRWKGKVSVDREQHAVEISRALARNLRSRAPKEIPSEPGFCIDHAYIAGDSFQVERFGVGVTFPEHPGARFEFRSSTGAELNSLLERVDGFVQNMLSTFAGMETLRKGKILSGAFPERSIWLREAIRGSAAIPSCGRFKARRNR